MCSSHAQVAPCFSVCFMVSCTQGVQSEVGMGILKRLNSLIKSNLNDLVSRVEDPRKQYEQAILDMENSLQQAKKQVIQAIADEKRMLQDAERCHEEVVRWETRAQAAVRAGDDNLAREALRQKKRAEEEETALRKNAANQRALVEELKSSLVKLEAKVADARARKDSVLARQQLVAGSRSQRGGALRNTEAFDAFERQVRSIDELDAQVEAMRELEGDPEREALDKKFENLEKGSDVDDALAALKAKLSS